MYCKYLIQFIKRIRCRWNHPLYPSSGCHVKTSCYNSAKVDFSLELFRVIFFVLRIKSDAPRVSSLISRASASNQQSDTSDSDQPALKHHQMSSSTLKRPLSAIESIADNKPKRQRRVLVEEILTEPRSPLAVTVEYGTTTGNRSKNSTHGDLELVYENGSINKTECSGLF